MAQYKHDRFFKFYIQSLYKTKGDTQQNIQVRNDEDLEIDLMFIGEPGKEGWQQEDLGLFDRLMQEHPTIIVEHYSSYLEETDLNKSITRKNLYWEPKKKELTEIAKTEQKLTSSKRLSREAVEQIDNQNPFTWILTVNCSEKILTLCDAQPDPELGVGVYRLMGLLRMGIVIIDYLSARLRQRLPDSPETMWLKMLGNRESAQSAFQSITSRRGYANEQLSPDRREKNDIIRVCIKYCVYLKDIPTDSLTPEEQDFMKTMAQVDAWYETEMNKAQLEGELRGKLKGKLEGKLEGKKEIAINLLRKNIALEMVAEVTGFTIDQLQQLRLSEREATSTNE
jgi:hypothetical protein